MGMPFPTGLRAIGTEKEKLQATALEPFSVPAAANSAIEWAWALNAASSVLGSVVAIVIALHFGLSVVLACAAAAYLSATAFTVLWQSA
jgi:hypothetical protein